MGSVGVLIVRCRSTGPRSTPFYNDSCSDTETTPGDGDALLHPRNDGKHFLAIKEEIDDGAFFKTNNNLPVHPFSSNHFKYFLFVVIRHFPSAPLQIFFKIK
jgi:hypothetical protein